MLLFVKKYIVLFIEQDLKRIELVRNLQRVQILIFNVCKNIDHHHHIFQSLFTDQRLTIDFPTINAIEKTRKTEIVKILITEVKIALSLKLFEIQSLILLRILVDLDQIMIINIERIDQTDL